jgi:D-alanine-D-alanine ligase
MPSDPVPSSVCHLGVVFGGASGEHAVSIRSANTVVGALRRGANEVRYKLSCFYIDRQGRWWPPAVAEAVLERGVPAEAADLPGPLTPAGFRGFPAGALEVEVWFPVLHGPNGEDGTIQGLFSLMQVPYVGSGVLGSAVGMDKQAMKAAFAAAGLPQVPYACVEAAELAKADASEHSGSGGLLDRLEAELGYPCFVKPANMGSSVGISKATDRASLLEGLRQAAALDPRLVVERGVSARELECAVLGTTELRASVLGEICFDADWYDYTTKYSEGLSHTVIPAKVPAELAERAQAMAIAACRAVAASGLSRVDFFYDQSSGDLWLNEINTLPGFTSQSMYPMLWAASGLPLEDLVHALVQGARESCGTPLSPTQVP